MEPKPPTVPREQRETVRRQVMDLLGERPLSAREISMAVGIAEKEVYPHLEHIRHTLQQERHRLLVTPAACKRCGFVFRKRERLTRPGKCPLCRSEAIAEPLFVIR